VPPPKCPECGRFLKQSLVASLSDEPTPCPRCETGLVATMFAQGTDGGVETDGGLEATVETTGGVEAVDGERSVRPPDLGISDPVPVAVQAPTLAEGHDADRGSVRPPDLPPVTVRDEPRDVLADWDRGFDPIAADPWRADRAPFPVDAVVVGGAGALGALVGALASDRRLRGATIGGLAGVVGAAVFRQVWRLEP
jgi:hypothetical protein